VRNLGYAPAGLAIAAAALASCVDWRYFPYTEEEIRNFNVPSGLHAQAVWIAEFTARTGELPRELGGEAGTWQDPVDWWGRPYIYSVDGEVLTIASYGADGLPGGRDEDRDFVSRWLVRRYDGTLWPTRSDWILEAELTEDAASILKFDVLRRAIDARWVASRSIPESLEELRSHRPGELSTTDGWGHPLVYDLSATRVRIRSNGRDGKLGAPDDAEYPYYDWESWIEARLDSNADADPAEPLHWSFTRDVPPSPKTRPLDEELDLVRGWRPVK
jgi:hypothetical protein